ncbi:MAG: hypothetical protein ACK5LO_05440 [Leucobacter sp.]
MSAPLDPVPFDSGQRGPVPGDPAAGGSAPGAPAPFNPLSRGPAPRPKQRGAALPWIIAAAAVGLLIGGGSVAVIAVLSQGGANSASVQGSAGQDPAPTTADDPEPEPTRDPEPSPTAEPVEEPVPAETGSGLSDPEAASALVFSASQLAGISFTDWDQDLAAAPVDADTGFCGAQLTRGPSEFVQATYNLSVDGPGTLPQVAAAGAVFASAEDAAAYMEERATSAACGSWEQQGGTVTVFEPPTAPALVGCQCQNVALHELVLALPDGTEYNQFVVLSQQDRYVAAAFYNVSGEVDGLQETQQLVAEIMDLTVAQVNDVAEGAGR